MVIALAQLIGYCYQLGQMKIVTVFILVAFETMDVLMVKQAYAKGVMLETFFTKNNSKGMSLFGISDWCHRLIYFLTHKGLVVNMLGEDGSQLSEEDEDGGIVMESSSTWDGKLALCKGRWKRFRINPDWPACPLKYQFQRALE